jgi:hypothetical protein
VIAPRGIQDSPSSEILGNPGSPPDFSSRAAVVYWLFQKPILRCRCGW